MRVSRTLYAAVATAALCVALASCSSSGKGAKSESDAGVSVALYPAKEGGDVGWCWSYYGPGLSNGISCPVLATRASSILDQSWESPAHGSRMVGIAITGPNVAAVSVNGEPPQLTQATLPYGYRTVRMEGLAQTAGQRRDRKCRGSLSSVGVSGRFANGETSPPCVIPLNAQDRPISFGAEPGSRSETPSGYDQAQFWQLPQRQPKGVCEIAVHGLPELTAQWGHVVTAVEPRSGIVGPAPTSCVDTEYYLGKTPFDAAILLNASTPGKSLALAMDATPIAGHPHLLDIAGGMTARSVGDAWLVVEGGDSQVQRILVLAHLDARRYMDVRKTR
jgi:hypothetical protein